MFLPKKTVLLFFWWEFLVLLRNFIAHTNKRDPKECVSCVVSNRSQSSLDRSILSVPMVNILSLLSLVIIFWVCPPCYSHLALNPVPTLILFSSLPFKPDPERVTACHFKWIELTQWVHISNLYSRKSPIGALPYL